MDKYVLYAIENTMIGKTGTVIWDGTVLWFSKEVQFGWPAKNLGPNAVQVLPLAEYGWFLGSEDTESFWSAYPYLRLTEVVVATIPVQGAIEALRRLRKYQEPKEEV